MNNFGEKTIGLNCTTWTQPFVETVQSFNFRSEELSQEADHGHHSVSLDRGCVSLQSGWTLCRLECEATDLHCKQTYRTKCWIQKGRCVTSLSRSHAVQKQEVKTYLYTSQSYIERG